MSGHMVPVPRDLLERLADHAAALSHSNTTQEQRDAARSDAEEADNVLSFAALDALAPAEPPMRLGGGVVSQDGRIHLEGVSDLPPEPGPVVPDWVKTLKRTTL